MISSRDSRRELCGVVVAIAALASLSVSPALAATASETIGKMKSFDASMTSAWSVRAEIERYPHPRRPEQGTARVQVEMTSDGATTAIRQISTYTSPPQYKARDGSEYVDQDFDQDGNLLVFRQTSMSAFVGPDVAGSSTVLELFKISPDNRVVSVERIAPSVLLFSPEKASDFVNLRYLSWAAGRGLSRLIPAGGSAATRSDGRVEVTAAARVSNIDGEWKVSVDPDAAYMVRAGTFSPAGMSAPMIAVRTFGTRWFGDIAVPERAEISLQADIPEAMQRVRFIDASAGGASALLAETRRAIEGPFEPNTDVTDYRDSAKGPTHRIVK
jgi:hypothetical protein